MSTLLDKLKSYRRNRLALEKDLARLEDQAAQLRKELGMVNGHSPSRPLRAPVANNKLTLREAVGRVTKDGPKTKQEIMNGVLALGYRFSGADPMNALGALLYQKKYVRSRGPKGRQRFQLK